MADQAQILAVWNQVGLPVVVRRTGKGQQPRLRLPYSAENFTWLRNKRKARPSWTPDQRYWEIPKSWFNDTVERCLKRFDSVWIIQPYRQQEKCAPACMNARGHECQCSCMGSNHGLGNDGSWFEVNEAFAAKWGGLEWACRKLSVK